jgi:DNA repair exonuclease SbcCD ATPase subunit
VGGKEIVTVPTLEEEVRELKGALSVMQSRHLFDVQQLSERIDALQRQLDKQRVQISEQGQSMQQLEKALIYQFNALNQYINRRFDEQTEAIRAQFENTNVPLTMLTVTVQSQGQDIKELKLQVAEIRRDMKALEQGMNTRFEQVGQQVAKVRQDMNVRFERVDQRFEQVDQQIAEVRQDMKALEQSMNARFDAQGQILNQILERLPH